MRERLPQALMYVPAAGVREPLASLFGFVESITVRNLRHRRNVFGIEFAERIHVAKNRVQVADHAYPLVNRQFQIGEVRDVGDVFSSNFHKIQKQQSQEKTSPRSRTSPIWN